MVRWAKNSVSVFFHLNHGGKVICIHTFVLFIKDNKTLLLKIHLYSSKAQIKVGNFPPSSTCGSARVLVRLGFLLDLIIVAQFVVIDKLPYCIFHKRRGLLKRNCASWY